MEILQILSSQGEVSGRTIQYRQDDPISSYLFLLCAEGFSALIHAAEEQGALHGIKLAPGAPSVNHLLLADDSLLLVEATIQGAKAISSIL